MKPVPLDLERSFHPAAPPGDGNEPAFAGCWLRAGGAGGQIFAPGGSQIVSWAHRLRGAEALLLFSLVNGF